MATTGELGRDYRHPAVDLSRLTVHEIVSAIHVVEEAYSRIPVRLDDPGRAEVSDQDRRLAAYEPDLGEAFIHQLPNADPQKTRDVFGLLSWNDSITDRKFAGFYIGVLVRVDHDYGLELWQRLLNDDHAGVADAAWTPVESLLESALDGSGDALREDGITQDDLLSLASDYVRRLTRLRREAEGLPWHL
jgi:hypothetical protein